MVKGETNILEATLRIIALKRELHNEHLDMVKNDIKDITRVLQDIRVTQQILKDRKNENIRKGMVAAC